MLVVLRDVRETWLGASHVGVPLAVACGIWPCRGRCEAVGVPYGGRAWHTSWMCVEGGRENLQWAKECGSVFRAEHAWVCKAV